jgi:hypothetical protein
VELLIALAITAALLTAVMTALDASFMAYQSTTEVASTHTISRLTMSRMLTLIRTGIPTEFRPLPANPLTDVVESDFIDIGLPDGDVLSLEWDEDEEALYVMINQDPTQRHLLLEGVIAQFDDTTGDQISPFTLEYERGRSLFRATIDLAVVPDDNMDVQLDGNSTETIRLVASAMPRTTAYGE